jgi:glutamate 5-kinase
MKQHADIKQSRRWVVKVGSALLTAQGSGLDRGRIRVLVDQIADLTEQGQQIVLVSSGAVAEGMQRMGWVQRPQTLHELQAAAAIGQMGLVQAWESCFQRRGLHTAQILLTHDDIAHRQRYLNVRGTLRTLVKMGVIPVVNENDTVANDELRFGDNDSLAALVANLLEADLMLLLTDQQGLYSADPRQHSDAKLIHVAQADATELDAMAGASGGALGRGGMYTKLRAARLAGRSGAATVITLGSEPDVLLRLAQGEQLGTLLLSRQEPEAARKHWLAGHLQVRGKVALDDGAVRVLRQSGKSLLAVGVYAVEGGFKRGDLVACVDQQGREVARGLVNYSAAETRKIKGKASSAIEAILGYVSEEELVHRDNLILV